MWFKDFECNRTSNSNSKYQLNWNIHVPHHRSGRGQAFSKTVCRAGGKPSTWFLPGTRRADNFAGNLFKCLLLGRYSNSEFLWHYDFQIFLKFLKIFIKISTFLCTHTRVQNSILNQHQSWDSWEAIQIWNSRDFSISWKFSGNC